jgi:hypothetical protein
VQLDPIKPTLKAPGTKRLTLKYNELLSNVAFKLNLRHYTVAQQYYVSPGGPAALSAHSPHPPPPPPPVYRQQEPEQQQQPLDYQQQEQRMQAGGLVNVARHAIDTSFEPSFF